MREKILDVGNLEFRARPDKAVDQRCGQAQHATSLRVIFYDLLRERHAAGLLVEGDRQLHPPVHSRRVVVAIVLADATQIHQVVLNLCTNAAAAIRGGGRLVLRQERVMVGHDDTATLEPLAPGPYVRVTVSDNGVGMDEETRRRFLEQVKEQVERLSKLSVDLLDLSKLESGSLQLRPEHVDLGELTRSVSGEFEPALAQHDSHLELRLASRRIEAQCDPVRVAQIVRILIDNALTHTAPGTRIVVTAARENGHLRLAVRDDGEGIESAALTRIFEPFYTADDVQGSGLGLTIASELAERMSGSLSVRSRDDETTFTLELPA